MNWKVLGAGFLVVAPLVVVLASGFGRDPKALPNVIVLDVVGASETGSFLERRGSAYPNLLDLDQRVAIDYGVAGVPETYVIDGQGRIARKFVGPVSAAALAEVLGSL